MKHSLNKLLVIGHTFPEPSTTAAGSRMMQLISMFQNWEWKITFAAAATKTPYSEDLKLQGIYVEQIFLNDDAFDKFIKELQPDVVLFDRFITEEQFGWRVSENVSDALRILDTEDLHFLRKAREEAVRKGMANPNLHTELAKREIGSILRSDLSLIISEEEMDVLKDTFQISKDLLHYLPFLLENTIDESPAFEERKHFMTIGNLKHAPNVDAVMMLKQKWSEIRRKLPKTECHVYGNYADSKILNLSNSKDGFVIKGWTPDLREMMENYRVLLAPIRFGAGLKGKIIDGFQYGLPSVTTAVGAEGIPGNCDFGGIISELDDFSNAAVKLYSNKTKWENAQKNGYTILYKRFQKKMFQDNFHHKIKTLSNSLDSHRNKNFIGQILHHNLYQRTKFMSKWIMEKNKNQTEN